jgi:t-SNARE complex subunit (syntaxin)
MPDYSPSTFAEDGINEISKYIDVIENNMKLNEVSMMELQNKNVDLVNKNLIQVDQLREIEQKEKLLLTRSRMLQIAQDRNAYKKKIIYTLIAVIFMILILTIVLYVIFTRRFAAAK